MSENRMIAGHTSHGVRGPHSHLPTGFVPLRLRLEAEGELIELTCPIAVVGRHSEADLRIAHPEISRRHCRLSFKNGAWRIRDLNSLNGVILNNKPIAEATLFAGDRLRLGCVSIIVEAATPTGLLPILPADQRRAG